VPMPIAAAPLPRELVDAAMDLLLHLQPLVADTQQAAWAQRWQALFGARARALGWQPTPGESDDDRLLRNHLLPAVAVYGQDEALRDEAHQRAQAWLADRSTLAPDLRGAVLNTAARAGKAPAGDRALFDALLAALRQGSDRQERKDLLSALGSFRAPVLADRALQLLLDPDIDIRDSYWPLLRAQTDATALRAQALAFVARHHAELVKRLGPEESAWLPGAFSEGCSEPEAQQLTSAFAAQAGRFTGGQQALARAVETVRLCSAWRTRQTSGL
jgi:cytosol alanyl aminopeptidase